MQCGQYVMSTSVYSYRILALQENFLLQFKMDVSVISNPATQQGKQTETNLYTALVFLL